MYLLCWFIALEGLIFVAPQLLPPQLTALAIVLISLPAPVFANADFDPEKRRPFYNMIGSIFVIMLLPWSMARYLHDLNPTMVELTEPWVMALTAALAIIAPGSIFLTSFIKLRQQR